MATKEKTHAPDAPEYQPTEAELAAAAAAKRARLIAEAESDAGHAVVDPMTMRVKAHAPEQGEFIVIDVVNFDPAVYEPFDAEAERIVGRRRARTRLRALLEE